MTKPREFWIIEDGYSTEVETSLNDAKAVAREIGKLATINHVIEKSAYDELSKKLEAAEKELKARRTLGECGHGRLQTIIIEAQEKVASLEAKNVELRAQLWVAKDSALRTYDGLAQKADKADELEAQLAVAVEGLESIAQGRGTHAVIADDALAKIKEMAEGKK